VVRPSGSFTLVKRCDALYVNFISGHEMELDTARALRMGYRGPTYADLHSLFLAVGAAGLRVPAKDGVGRPCRPANIASDRVVSVVNKVNPKLVYEDASGLKIDPTTLKPGTEVVVNVATGIACKS